MDSSEQEIAAYIAQNEAVVVVVELFKRGKFFGTLGIPKNFTRFGTPGLGHSFCSHTTMLFSNIESISILYC